MNRRNNREAEVPACAQAGQALKGPVDHGVPVLAVRTPRGQLLAVVCSYACHATTLSFYQWSRRLARLRPTGPGVQASGGHGHVLRRLRCRPEPAAAADGRVVPAVRRGAGHGGRRACWPGRYGRSSRGCRPRLPSWTWSSNARRRATSCRAIASRGGYEGRWAKRLLAEVEQGAPFATSHPYPIQVWTLGRDQLWIALGGEVVVDYALTLKQKYGPTTWVAGYTNDVMAYIPSQRVWQEGGYEAGAFAVYGLPTQRWKAGLEDRILRAVAGLVGR